MAVWVRKKTAAMIMSRSVWDDFIICGFIVCLLVQKDA